MNSKTEAQELREELEDILRTIKLVENALVKTLARKPTFFERAKEDIQAGRFPDALMLGDQKRWEYTVKHWLQSMRYRFDMAAPLTDELLKVTGRLNYLDYCDLKRRINTNGKRGTIVAIDGPESVLDYEKND